MLELLDGIKTWCESVIRLRELLGVNQPTHSTLDHPGKFRSEIESRAPSSSPTFEKTTTSFKVCNNILKSSHCAMNAYINISVKGGR
jgi:hypothetical protein